MDNLSIRHVFNSVSARTPFVFSSGYPAVSHTIYRKLLLISNGVMLTTLDPKSCALLSTKDLASESTAIACSPATGSLILGGAGGEVTVFPPGDGELKSGTVVTKFSSAVRRLEISSDGKVLIAISSDPAANLAFLDSGNVVKCEPGHVGGAISCSISPNGKYMATAGCDGVVNIHEIKPSTEEVTLAAKEKVCDSAAEAQSVQVVWSDNDSLLISGATDVRTMRVGTWKLESLPKLHHPSTICGLCPVDSEAGLMLVTAAADNCIRVWNCKTEARTYTSPPMEAPATDFSYCRDMGCIVFTVAGAVKLLVPGAVKAPIIDSEKQAPKEPVLPVANLEQTALSKEIKAATENLLAEPMKDILAPPESKADDLTEEESKMERVISAFPQGRFQINETRFSSGSRFLCWNNVGSITLIAQKKSSVIFIDFTNKTFHRNLSLPDPYKVSLGTMTYGGAILASQTKELDINEYQEDDDESTRFSVVQFVGFGDSKNDSSWDYKLPEGENAECVAIGARWAAVYTDMYNVRIFSHEGAQRHVFSTATPVVTMCGYEDLLAIVSHHSVPVLGNQQLNLRVLDAKQNCETVLETAVPLSPESTLKWIGFSEEGQIFTYDSKGILRALLTYMGNTWIPVLNAKEKDPSKDLWVVSVGESEVIGVELEAGTTEPLTSDKNQVKVFQLRIPFLHPDSGSDATDLAGDVKTKEADKRCFEEEYMLETMKVRQELYRKQMWGHLKRQRKRHDPEYCQTALIADDEDLQEAQKKIDLTLLDKIRLCCVNGENEKAVTYAEMVSLTKTLVVALGLAQKIASPAVVAKISFILEARFLVVTSHRRNGRGRRRKRRNAL